MDAYFVCATPRTGSSLLLGLLESTGVAGHPQAYFHAPDEPSWADRWGIPRTGYGDYAVSWLRAEPTGAWYVGGAGEISGGGGGRAPSFDADRIGRFESTIPCEHNAAWEEWIERYRRNLRARSGFSPIVRGTRPRSH